MRWIAYLESRGRRAIIWNNICRPTVDKRAVNHFWRPETMEAAGRFATSGYDIFNSDSSVLYYDRNPQLRKVYDYDPVANRFPGALGKKVAGVEACRWSEHLPDLKSEEHDAYPLIFAHSKLWTTPERKDWDSFVARLTAWIERCQQLGIKCNRQVSEDALAAPANSPSSPAASLPQASSPVARLPNAPAIPLPTVAPL